MGTSTRVCTVLTDEQGWRKVNHSSLTPRDPYQAWATSSRAHFIPNPHVLQSIRAVASAGLPHHPRGRHCGSRVSAWLSSGPILGYCASSAWEAALQSGNYFTHRCAKRRNPVPPRGIHASAGRRTASSYRRATRRRTVLLSGQHMGCSDERDGHAKRQLICPPLRASCTHRYRTGRKSLCAVEPAGFQRPGRKCASTPSVGRVGSKPGF